MKVLLVVDDDREFQDGLLREHSGKVEILQAFTHDEARRVFMDNAARIDKIALDGSLLPNSTGADTIELIPFFREHGFAGEMVGISSHRSLNRALEKAGCSDSILKDQFSEAVPFWMEM